jgi:adenylate cyclase
MADATHSGKAELSRRVTVNLRQIGWARSLITLAGLLLAFFVALKSWDIPLLRDAERTLFDYRQVLAAPKSAQDKRILMVPYTDETTRLTYKRSPLDRGIMAKALKRLDSLGPKAIGIDILIDQPQLEDDELIAVFRGMKTPTHLAFASTDAASDKILFEQTQFLKDFQAKIKTNSVGPTNIVIQADGDNVLRRWANITPGAPPRIPNAMIPEAKAFANYKGSVVYLQPALKEEPVFATIPIETFAQDELFASPEAVEMFREQVQGRYILIGGNLVDIDVFETPMTRLAGKDESPTMWGVDIYAHMLAQALDNRFLAPVGIGLIGLASLLVVLGGAITGAASLRPIFAAPVMIAQLAAIVGVPFWFGFSGFDTYGLPAFGWLIGWALAFAFVGAAARALGAEKRKFAQSALGKYLPADIAGQIMKDPDSLRLHGEKREIYVVFTDLEGFTKLSHAIEPEMVATLLNRYLDMLSDVVLKHGGTIDKFVGDAVVAFWGAPISRPDDADRAVRAAIAMHEAGEEFRRTVPEGVPPIGKTRAGLHFGEAIVGNFGGEGRIQYTALGDSMNTAARLESANKQTKSSVMVSDEVVKRTSLDIFRPMGEVVLRGRATPIAIFEPVPSMPDDERKHLSALSARAIKGDAAALQELSAESEKRPDDKSLGNLVYRLTNQETGGYFVLD